MIMGHMFVPEGHMITIISMGGANESKLQSEKRARRRARTNLTMCPKECTLLTQEGV